MKASKTYVGTVKGLFTFDSEWEAPIVDFKGESIFSLAVAAGRVWAAPFSEWKGPSVAYSDDGGKSWNLIADPLRFPEGSGASVAGVWQIEPFSDDAVYFGVEPAALFKFDVGTQTWELCEGLWNHPHRAQWQPGYGGLCLHTILFLTQEEWVVGISTGGVYRTEDGGANWTASNQTIVTPFLPEKTPEFGQCVHKIAFHPSNPQELFLQHHWGIYRSVDGGRSWETISEDKGLPSDFGFACVSNSPGRAFVIPIESNEFRCFPGGRMRVFRTDDAGGNWHESGTGLPDSVAYDGVLRDSFFADGERMVFGTTSGSVFLSEDGGGSWRTMATNLPRITCVRL